MHYRAYPAVHELSMRARVFPHGATGAPLHLFISPQLSRVGSDKAALFSCGSALVCPAAFLLR